MDILTGRRSLLHGRRDFIRKAAFGTAGAALGSLGLSACSSQYMGLRGIRKPAALNPGDANVSFTTGSDRRDMIYHVLEPFKEHLSDAIRDKQVVVKLNCVGQNGLPLMVTHPDAVRGVLDFLKPIYDRTVIIGESPVQNKNPEKTFELFGYLPLEEEYNARCVDLNTEPTSYQWILDGNMNPQRISIINTFLDPDNYIISVTRLKTHNCVVATLSLKNVVMGSPIKIPRLRINEKAKMHAGSASPKFIHHNIFLMAHRVRPDFAVLDGFESVEGNGPAHGDPLDHKVAVAGPDFVAVDSIGAELMGIDPGDIGYLKFCGTAGLG
ncbi:DUF362 domain-containing protein, partial [Candidatus Latescibacterota bacterium]